jgi:hypothetical protein
VFHESEGLLHIFDWRNFGENQNTDEKCDVDQNNEAEKSETFITAIDRECEHNVQSQQNTGY